MKYLIRLSLIICFNFSFAQLSISNLDNGTPILDGDVFNYDKLGSATGSDGKLKFKITNTSTTETIKVLGQMVSFTNTNGTNCQFCVNPECYFNVSPGQTIPNVPVELAPGADNGNFDSFYNSNPGDGVNYPLSYTFRFFMVDDTGNEVGDDVTITYNYTPENFSTNDFSLADLGITLENTVVSDNLNFIANTDISFEVYDMIGRAIGDYSFKAGQHQVNMSDLSSGNFILIFEDDSGKQSQVRIQKR